MNSTSRHIVCILNGSRPLSAAIDGLLNKMRAEPDWNVEILTTTRAKEASDFANLVSDRATHIVAVGGDGTLNEVVNGMMQGKSKAFFAFIPNGTGNDYQRNFGVWERSTWWEAFCANRHLEVDLCKVEGSEGTHFALNIAGCGFDGHVVRLLNRQRENWKLKGKFSYATAILRAFFSYRKPRLQILSAEFEWKGPALMLVACKGTTFGHGLIIAPDARLDNAQLECVLLGNVSLMDYVRNLGNLRKGRKIVHPEAHYFRTQSVRVLVESGNLSQESDGELGEKGSLEIAVQAAALKLICITRV